MSDMLKPSMNLLVTLGSLAVHIEEFLSSDGHEVDLVAIQTLLANKELKDWIKEMGPLLPLKRGE